LSRQKERHYAKSDRMRRLRLCRSRVLTVNGCAQSFRFELLAFITLHCGEFAATPTRIRRGDIFQLMKSHALFSKVLARCRFAVALASAIVMSTAFAQSRITSASSRATIPTAGLSATFTISGSAPKSVLVDAIGPGLAVFGISGTIADPQLTLRNSSGAIVGSNDNWGGDAAVSSARNRVGGFTLSTSSRDAALLITLNPGTYTATITGVGGQTGTALVEIYDADTATNPASVFSHLAIRSFGGTGADGLTVGVVGSGTVPLMVRALGPALISQGVTGAMTDPSLSVFSGPTMIASNDNWGNDAALAAAATQLGAIALGAGSRDSAVLASLNGPITISVNSVNFVGGIVQLEIFSLAGVTAKPVVTSSPTDASLLVGAPLTLTANAGGLPAATYQWQKNGAPIAGATSATLTLPAVQPADAGTYTLVVTNAAGSVSTTPAVITVTTAVAPTITTVPVSQSITVGTPLTLTVGVAGVPAPTYQWQKDGVAIPGATAATLSIATALPPDAASYTVTVTNSAGAVTSAPAIITILPSAWLSNLSVRTAMTDGQILSVGMVVTGTRNVLVRAAGPALAQLGLSGLVANPRMALFNAQSVQILANDDWDASLASRFTSVGAFAFPVGSRDAAFVQNVTGQVSVQVTAGGAGTLLVEGYDLESGTASRLVNMSVLNRVGTGDGVLIAGFSVSGTGSKRLLIRAVGPSLTPLGLTGVLADPRLEVLNSSNVRVGLSDNWDPALAATMTSAGAFALLNGSRDSALVLTLPVGSYSAIMSGADGGTGQGIIELYELP
jgi:hypothetical protein